MVKSANTRPIAVDLFAGAGGLSLGFEQAGFDVRACVELDPVHCAVHQFNFPDCATICRSVADPLLTGASIREFAGIGNAPVDVVVGGPPCQGFSLMGKRAFEDPRNHLVKHFLRLVLELDARYFVFENVKGLTIGRHRQFLEELILEFENNGYNILKPWQVLNAIQYGVPQDRERLFLYGARAGERLPKYPEPRFCAAGMRVEFNWLPFGPSVAEALADLPDAESFPELLDSDSVKTKLGEPSQYAAFLRGIELDPEDLSYPRQHDSSIMSSSLRTEHTLESRKRFAETTPGRVEPISRFLRLDPDGVCNTLRAGTASDRGAFTSPRPIHPFYARCITVREAARLHSYPDWFRLHVTKWHGARQIGNSVPPLLARAVARQVILASKERPTRPSRTAALGDESLLRLSMFEAALRYGVSTAVVPQRIRKPVLQIAQEGVGIG